MTHLHFRVAAFENSEGSSALRTFKPFFKKEKFVFFIIYEEFRMGIFLLTA